MSLARQIWLFLAIIVIGSVVFNTAIVHGGGITNPATANLVTALMWTPGAAAIIVRLLATRSLAGLGWWPGRPGALLTGWIAPVIYGGVPFLLAGLFGAGTFDPTAWARAGHAFGGGAPMLIGLLRLILAGMLISLLSATGEEIGWRGFLVPALTERFGFWRMTAISGPIWIAYHLPLILLAGYSGAGTPLWLNLFCFSALVLIITPFLAALRLRAKSFWPTALAHASHNLFIQLIFAEALIPNAATPWLVGEFGLLTPGVAAAVVAVYFWRTGLPREPSRRGGQDI